MAAAGSGMITHTTSSSAVVSGASTSTGSSERNPLEETERCLKTLTQMATNAECIARLIEGLHSCITSIMTASDQADNCSLDQLFMALLNQIIQTCHKQLEGASCGAEKLTVLYNLTRLLRITWDMLAGPECNHFTALVAMNRILDLSILNGTYQPWEYEDKASEDISAKTETIPVPTECSTLHAQLEFIKRGAPRIGSTKDSPKHRLSWRSRSFNQQDSIRSIKSFISPDSGGGSVKETSFTDEPDCAYPPSNCDSQRTPTELLLSYDPSPLLTILKNAITKHKTVMGARQKCTPSQRWRHCTYHCLQVLSARVFTLLCHGNTVQYKVVNDGHIKILVDALDPNHDPHLLCLILQALACIAMNPSYHGALSEADIPDTLMQLLLPSDEWYYTNHSTKYARYVKYHAARILVYMGLFYRLGGRVDLFDTKIFEDTVTNPLLQMNNPEDSFIDNMALGKLLLKSSTGHVIAGSVEGIFAEIITASERRALSEHLTTVFTLDSTTPSVSGDAQCTTVATSQCPDSAVHHPVLCQSSSLSSTASAELSFEELFFQTVPFVVHPIIILRLLCHKMFGHMLRRKTHLSAQNLASSHSLSPPLIIESECCPPLRRSSTEGNATAESPPINISNSSSKKKKNNVHVQITMPSPTTQDSIDPEVVKRARTRRANSVDKSLFRVGSLRRSKNHATMTLAIKAIGDSLVTPLDLNLSPPPHLNDLELEAKNKRNNIFRFPSVKKRISKSYGYLAGLGHSLDEEYLSVSVEDSTASLAKENDSDIKEFQRELINLPMYEVDTPRLDQSTSPLLSRSNSVPEHIGGSKVSAESKNQMICQITVTTNAETETTQAQPALSSGPLHHGHHHRHHHHHHASQHCQHNHHQAHEQDTVSMTVEDNSEESKRPVLTLPITETTDTCADNIIVHFAAATPMESPASNIDEAISPIVDETCLGEHLQTLESYQQQQEESGFSSLPKPSKSMVDCCITSSHDIPTHRQLLSVNTHFPFTTPPTSCPISPITLSSTATSLHSECTIRTMTPNAEINTDHLGVMRAVEIWVRVCSLDLESNAQVRREMKDFLAKMASLGPEYRIWSHRISEKLKLEEPDAKRTSTVAPTDIESVHAQYKKLQQLVVNGDLPCSKEEAATLAGIQLHVDETWPEESEPESIQTEEHEEREQDRLLKNDKFDTPTSKRRDFVQNRTKKFASSRRRGAKLTKTLMCLGEGEDPIFCIRGIDGTMADCLPPDFHRSRKIRQLIEEKQTKLWHTPYYDNELKLKQLYIRICKNLPIYSCKFYKVKELAQGNTGKKIQRLLGIGQEKVVLLDDKTKLLLRSHPISELQEWITGSGKGHDGLILEFRGSKPWTLMASSVENLKAMTAALWEVMDMDGRFLDCTLLQRDVLDFDFSRRHLAMRPELETYTVYTEELEQLQHLLHFPEEVATRLTDAEYTLFNSVLPLYYIRQVTVDLSKASTVATKPNVQQLIQRFNEVSSWVTHIIITQPTHDDRKAVLSCILRIASSCWNMGGFNAAVEILTGLKSEKLKPFWLSLSDEDLSVLDKLTSVLLARDPTKEYRDAVTRALSVDGCRVVPFFGTFLRDLQSVLSGVPSIIVLPSDADDDNRDVEFISNYNGEDRFLTRIGVGGLINLERLKQAQSVLSDIHLFQQRARQQELEERSESSDEDDVDGKDVESDYDIETDHYQPIEPTGDDHGVMVISPKISRVHLHDLQCMHHGVTMLHVDMGTNHSAICYLQLENDNATLSWSKPQWSALRGGSGSLPDYSFQSEIETHGLVNKYAAGLQVIDELDEGHIDLSLIKEVNLRDSNSALSASIKRAGLDEAAKQNCIMVTYGTNLSENRSLLFILPPHLARIWFRGLRRLVRAAIVQRRWHSDRRVQWLRDQYLQLYYEAERRQGPTPAEAIKVFGGRKWSAVGPTSPSSASDIPQQFRRSNSVTVTSKTIRKKPASSMPPSKETKSPGNSHSRHATDSGLDGLTIRDGSCKPRYRWMQSSGRSDQQSNNNNRNDITVNKSGKHTVSVYRPKNLTFNFKASGFQPRDTRRVSIGGRNSDPNKPITHSTILNFLDFMDLFKSFSLRCRKDLKDLFEQLATAKPTIEQKMPVEILTSQLPLKDTGLLTRNSPYDLTSVESRKMCDALAASSIVSNSTGVDTSKSKCLGIVELREFLEDFQEMSVTDEEIMRLIHKHEPDEEFRGLCKMSFEGFARYLMDKDNFAFLSEHAKQETDDMDHPMSHYYIETSHNTYLTGHQLKGESSVDLYGQVLLTGCRCVELDCWDGDDGEPIIYHGHTLTTKIPFRGVVEAVKKYAFVTSPYPVILSIENHCSIPQQQKMAQIFIEVLGDRLVKEFLFETDFSEDPSLPSPSQLKYRILVKNKKLRAPQTPQPVKQKLTGTLRANSFSVENNHCAYYEDDDDDEDDEDYMPDVKEIHLLHQSTSSEGCGASSDAVRRGSLPAGRQSSQESGQSVQSMQSRTTAASQAAGKLIRSASTDSLISAGNGSDSASSALVRRKTLCRLQYLENGGEKIPRSESLTEGLDAAPKHDHQKTNSIGSLIEPASKPLSQVSATTMTTTTSEQPAKSASLAASLEDVGIGTESNTSNTPRTSWLSSLMKGRSRDSHDHSGDSTPTSVHLPSNSRTKSHESHEGLEYGAFRLSLDDARSKLDSSMINITGKGEPSSVDWHLDDGSDHTPKANKKKKVQIAQELSDIVIYTQAVKFRGLEMMPAMTARQRKMVSRKSILPGNLGTSPSTPTTGPGEKSELVPPLTLPVRVKTYISSPSCYQLSSLNENKTKQVCRRQPIGVIKHTEKHIMRTYPAGMRIDSSNFNPVAFWMCGIQMVALNYQTEDTAMHVNSAMFEKNGHSGYILKPAVMWDKSHMMYNRFNPWEKEFAGFQPSTFIIQLISGQYVCPNNHHSSPQVEVELIGIPADSNKHKSKVISRNALNPIWNEIFTFQVYCPESAFLRFGVTDMGSSHLTAQRVVPLKCFRPGYRHVRLRSSANQPLELSTLFVYSRMDEDLPIDLISMAVADARDEKRDARKQIRGLIAKVKDIGELSKAEKEMLSGMPALRQKRRMFFISVYGVTPAEDYSIIKVTQDTSAQEVIQQALIKSGKADQKVEDYVLVEDVLKSWEKHDSNCASSQRVLSATERVMQAQNRWKGDGKFVLHKKSDHPGELYSEMSTPDWECQETFLVCVHNVSVEHPHTILQAPVISTAQDIITQAIMKARHADDPRYYVLVEEYTTSGSEGMSRTSRRTSSKTERRVLADDENVYAAQSRWKGDGGTFTLMHREMAEVQERKKKGIKPLQKLNQILNKEKKELRSKLEERAARTRIHAHDTAFTHHHGNRENTAEADKQALASGTDQTSMDISSVPGADYKTKSHTLPDRLRFPKKIR